MNQRSNSSGAFTRIELIVAALSLALFVGVLVPAMSERKRSAERAVCVANLKQISLAELIWIHDHETTSLRETSTNSGGSLGYLSRGEVFQYFKALSNPPAVLICPSDNRTAAANIMSLANSNLSYFVNMDGGPGTKMSPCPYPDCNSHSELIVAGDRNVTNGTAPTAGIISVTASNCHQLNWDGRMHNKGRKFFQDLIGNVAYLDGSAGTVTATNLQRPFKDVVSPSVTSRLVIP